MGGVPVHESLRNILIKKPKQDDPVVRLVEGLRSENNLIDPTGNSSLVQALQHIKLRQAGPPFANSIGCKKTVHRRANINHASFLPQGLQIVVIQEGLRFRRGSVGSRMVE